MHEHAGLVPGPVDEHVAVLRLAHRRGGHRGDRRVVHLGHLAEAIEGGDGTIDGVGAELPHVARARAEADHLLLAIEDLEAGPAVAGGHASDHTVHGVGPDVDSRQRLRGGFGRRSHLRVSLACVLEAGPRRAVLGASATLPLRGLGRNAACMRLRRLRAGVGGCCCSSSPRGCSPTHRRSRSLIAAAAVYVLFKIGFAMLGGLAQPVPSHRRPGSSGR